MWLACLWKDVDTHGRIPLKDNYFFGASCVIGRMQVVTGKRHWNYYREMPRLGLASKTDLEQAIADHIGKTPRSIILDSRMLEGGRLRHSVFMGLVCVCGHRHQREAVTAAERGAREREAGKYVPVHAVEQMRANFVMPESGDVFNVLVFPELPERRSRAAIQNIESGGSQRNLGSSGREPRTSFEIGADRHWPGFRSGEEGRRRHGLGIHTGRRLEQGQRRLEHDQQGRQEAGEWSGVGWSSGKGGG